MKTIIRITACALLSPLIIWCEFFLAGIIDIIAPNYGWIFFNILCTAVMIIVLLLEKRLIPEYWSLACNGAYFLSAAFYVFVWLRITGHVFDAYSVYDKLSMFLYGRDYEGSLIWWFFFVTILLQFALQRIIRIIIAIVRKLHKWKPT